MTPIPKIQWVPCAHNSLIRSLTFYYESTAIPSVLLGRLYPNWNSLLLFTAWPGWISGLLRTCVGMRAFLAISETLLCSLIWRNVTGTTFLQSSVCEIYNPNLQKLKWRVRSGGSITYQRNMASFHSCALLSSPFTVDGAMESHYTIFCLQRIWQSSIGDIPSTATERASPDSYAFQHQISLRPLLRSCT